MAADGVLAHLHEGMVVIVTWPGAGYVQGRSMGRVARVLADRVEVYTGFRPTPPPGSEMTLRIPPKGPNGHLPPVFLNVLECHADRLLLSA